MTGITRHLSQQRRVVSQARLAPLRPHHDSACVNIRVVGPGYLERVGHRSLRPAVTDAVQGNVGVAGGRATRGAGRRAGHDTRARLRRAVPGLARCTP